MLSSCYDKIDDFDILFDTEYSIERGTDTLFKFEEFVWMPDIRFPPFATKWPEQRWTGKKHCFLHSIFQRIDAIGKLKPYCV